MLLSLALIALGLVCVPVSRRMTGDYFSPAALVLSAWCGALGLYALRLLPYQPMRPSTAWFIAAAVLAMVAGIVLGQAVSGSRTGGPPSATRDVNRWLVGYSVLGLVGMGWYVWSVIRVMGPDAFASPAQVRIALGEYRIPSTYLFLQLFCMAGPMAAVGAVLCGHRLSRWTAGLLALCVVATWFTTDRTQFFLVTLTAFFTYVYRRGPMLSWRGLLGATAVCALLLGANFGLVGMWVGKTPQALGVVMQAPGAAGRTATGPSGAGGVPSPRRGEAGTQPPAGATAPGAERPVTSSAEPSTTPPASALPSFLTQLTTRLHAVLQRGSTIYLYLTGSFAALDVLLREDPSWTSGAHVLYPIVRALDRIGLLPQTAPKAIPEFRDLGLTTGRDIAFNGYTFLYYPWMDFGIAGAIVYAAAVGLASGLAYGWMRRNRASPVRLLVMAHVATALALSIFVNKFNNTASWYVALLTLIPFSLPLPGRRGSPSP